MCSLDRGARHLLEQRKLQAGCEHGAVDTARHRRASFFLSALTALGSDELRRRPTVTPSPTRRLFMHLR
jgi:hypothetical protein